MTASAEQKHHIPGRLRLRIHADRRNPDVLKQIRERLLQAPGVLGVDWNPVASSLTVDYDPALYRHFPGALLDFAAQNDLFTFDLQFAGDAETQPSAADRALDNLFGATNRIIQAGTGNVVSLKELLPLGIAASALIFVSRATAAAQWLSWLQFAWSSCIHSSPIPSLPSWLQFAWSSYFELHQDDPVHAVGREVEALRLEIAALRSLLEHRPEPQ